MTTIQSLDAKLRNLNTMPRLLLTVGLFIAIIVVPTVITGFSLQYFFRQKEPETKPLDAALTEADQTMREAVRVMLRHHGMSDVEISNWFAGCDQQASSLHVLEARKMLVQGMPQEVVDEYMKTPPVLDTSLSECRLP